MNKSIFSVNGEIVSEVHIKTVISIPGTVIDTVYFDPPIKCLDICSICSFTNECKMERRVECSRK